jgi:myo-inositol-1(or 4)-monophosphatase
LSTIYNSTITLKLKDFSLSFFDFGMINPVDYRQFIKEQLTKAAETANSYFGKVSDTIKEGDNNQVLTEADIAIGKQLITAVQEAYPEHNIIDEEAGGIDKQSQFTWVIDPIEATSNFAAGLPQYGIMIGILDGDTPVAGGIIAPAYNKLYLAAKGKGATCNDQIIHVTPEEDLLNVLISYGIDGHQEDPDRTKNECNVMADIILGCRNMRNSGCEALDPMYVAGGRYGGRVNTTSRIWDNVAPQIIAEEAGAIWTSANGESLDYSYPLTKIEQNFTFCVASPLLHKQLQGIIQGRLNS